MSNLEYRHIDRHERRYISSQYLNTPGYSYIAPHLDLGDSPDQQYDNNQFNIVSNDTKKHRGIKRTDVFEERPNFFKDEKYNNPINTCNNTYQNTRRSTKFIDNRTGRVNIPGASPIQPEYVDRNVNTRIIDKQFSAIKY
jgi:hypothetical protein